MSDSVLPENDMQIKMLTKKKLNLSLVLRKIATRSWPNRTELAYYLTIFVTDSNYLF